MNDLSASTRVDRTVGALPAVSPSDNAGGGDEWRPFLETTVEQLEAAFHFNVSVAFGSVPHMSDVPAFDHQPDPIALKPAR